MKKKLMRLFNLLVVPVLFASFGYFLLAVAVSPFWDVAVSAANLLSMEEPLLDEDLRSLFNESVVVLAAEQEEQISVADFEMPTFGTHYARISSARIGLSAPVFFGDSYDILRVGVGHNIGSSLPGFNGTILFAAHNFMHFLPLRDVELGDLVEIQTHYGTFVYEVVDISVRHANDENAFDLGQAAEELLVMYTCYPFNISAITANRLFVTARKIEGPVVNLAIN